jgi:hypothetical protein
MDNTHKREESWLQELLAAAVSTLFTIFQDTSVKEETALKHCKDTSTR